MKFFLRIEFCISAHSNPTVGQYRGFCYFYFQSHNFWKFFFQFFLQEAVCVFDKQKFLLFHTLFYDFCNFGVVYENILFIIEYLDIHYDLLRLFSLKIQDADNALKVQIFDEDGAEHLYDTLLFAFKQTDDIWDMLVKEDDDDQDNRCMWHIWMDDEARHKQCEYTCK